jgi:hypothetical protein
VTPGRPDPIAEREHLRAELAGLPSLAAAMALCFLVLTIAWVVLP